MTHRPHQHASPALAGRGRRPALLLAALPLLLSACGDGEGTASASPDPSASESDEMREAEAAFLRRYEAEGGRLEAGTTASSVLATARDWCRWRIDPDVPEGQFFGEVALDPRSWAPLMTAAEAHVCDVA